jgi:PIN domain nuclease of toxin-antitoxin system
MLNEEPGADALRAVSHRAYLSAVNYAEVITKLTRRGADEETARQALRYARVKIVPFDRNLAFVAGRLEALTARSGISLGDRARIALARKLEMPVLTGDRKWANVALGVEVRLFR